MALKTFKPYTKSTRGTILVDRSELWKGKPFKSLVSPKNAMKGRNNNGRITSINRAGGHKKMYRHVDFYRKKFDMPATVERIEYDPNRSCYIMLVKFQDNTHAYYLAPQKIKAGDVIENGSKKEIKVGNCMPLQDIPVGINFLPLLIKKLTPTKSGIIVDFLDHVFIGIFLGSALYLSTFFMRLSSTNGPFQTALAIKC